MELALKYIDFDATKYDVQKAIEAVLHGPDLYDPDNPDNKGRVPNFSVWLKESPFGRLHDGEGTLGLPSRRLGERLLDWIRDPAHRKDGIRVCGRKLYISRSQTRMSEQHQQILENAIYIPPEQEKIRLEILSHLQERLRVARVQFGTWYRPVSAGGKVQNRVFSVEYECDYTERSEAWVEVVYDHKLIKIELGSRYTEESCKFVSVKFTSINKIAVGEEFGNPYVVFDMIVPPDFEMMSFNGATPDGIARINQFKDRDRVCGLDDAHERVAPYSPHLRLVLFRMCDLQAFYRLCRIARCEPRPQRMDNVEANSRRFFGIKELHYMGRWLKSLDWRSAFQVEALLRNGLLNTNDILVDLRGPIEKVLRDFGSLSSEILRLFVTDVALRPQSETPVQCLQRVRDENKNVTPLRLAPGNFACHHITFTPTRTLLEGPYATQSNRVIRRYQKTHAPDLLDNFVRVDFREEDRLPFRWDRNVDGSFLLQQRVGRILKDGFELGGKHFEFLAYSTSALRSHAVWFMSSFVDPDDPKRRLVTPDFIRESILDFEHKGNEELVRQPSKLAARIALAFSGTDPSVTLVAGQWKEMPDIITIMDNGGKSCHTDGVGTISPELGDMIWAVMCEASSNYRVNRVKPSAYQIRFLGYKGVVVIDHRLTGVLMRLRKSQRKYLPHDVTHAPLEIARAFDYPNMAFLNKQVIMVLEDRGVPWDVFMELQNSAKRDVLTARESLDNFRKLLKANNLGNKFHLAFIVESLGCLGLDFTEHSDMRALGSEIFSRLLRYSINSVLRTMKHRARIPVPKSYKLVGVADEGVAYKNEVEEGERENVYTIPAGRIYACIQENPDDEPVYLRGMCTISRSPVIHPGDVQRVFAIGKPPEGKLCFFKGLKNVVVLPAQGPRSLASCLAGGDLDGDQFDIFINNPDLLPTERCEPAAYPDVKPRTLPKGQIATVDDICDFIVEYINSDILGLLSDRHLTIADQSKQGTYDRGCMMLSELCSRAVDYAKHGVPVDLSKPGTKLPRYLIPYKPDWHKNEVSEARDHDYYVSERAIGHLYRDITLIADDADLQIPVFSPGAPMTDTISSALLPIVQGVLSEDDSAEVESDAVLAVLASELFTRFSHELRYIRATHSVSSKADVQLSEEEVILGMILSTSTHKGLREDRTYRMKVHTETLVRDVRERLHRAAPDDEPPVTRVGLRRAWVAYAWVQEHRDMEGAVSFGLLVLGIVLDCLKILNALPKRETSPSLSDEDEDEYD